MTAARSIARAIIPVAAAVAGIFSTASCRHADDDRIPWADVRISFNSPAEWEIYGTPAAMDYQRFVRPERIPADYPYTALTYTGFGGVLLVADVMGTPQAFDLACPVEVRYDVRLFINDDFKAECPVCHSTYDVFLNYGTPLSGPAAQKGYSLKRYRVVDGSASEYRLVTN